MSIPGAGNPLLLGGAAGGYKIERSTRLNASDSAFFSRTPASAGNRKTWTWAGWVKRAALGSLQKVFGAGGDFTNAGITYLEFDSADRLGFYHYALNSGGYIWQKYSSQVFRDPSAWYHICVSYDSDNATGADRARLYVNGSRLTAFAASSDPSSGYQAQVNNSTQTHYHSGYGSSNQFFSGYLADIHFIDGQALTPSSFGEFDDNGIWQPKAYSGSYGTNGFKLAFADNSAATATTLGKDTSGNGNNWTPNNLSVTAGAGNDSLVDSPTNYGTDTGAGGEVRGNYATLNPLAQSSGTHTNGNLEYIGPSAWRATPSTILLPSSGKWYAEATLKAAPASSTFGGLYAGFGVIAPSAVSGWNYNNATSFYVTDTGLYSNYNSSSSGTVGTFTTGTVIGLAVNRDTNQVTVYQDGVSKVTVTLGITSGADLYFFNGSYDANYGQMALNFGQRPFAYTAPSGFKALCTTNLPTPTIADGSTAMDVALWTGNGSARSITGLGFNPDLVWIKGRSGATDHALYDSVRGATLDLVSNSTAAETTQTQGLTAFNSDGFSLGTLAKVNTNTATYAGWTWDAGSSTVTNTDGTISSQVRANASAGFSVVTWTGNGASATVGHGLGVAPSFLIVKSRSTSNSWGIYHRALGGAFYLLFDTSAAGGSANATWGSANSDPTASVFSVGSGAATNSNGSNFVAYCFAPVASYSAFGSYTGNGNADGPFVYTGFRPSYLLIKQSSASGQGWEVRDYAREPYNDANRTILRPNAADAEVTDAFPIDFLSNGFKLRSIGTGSNENTQTYIYAAFAENPFQYARAR